MEIVFHNPDGMLREFRQLTELVTAYRMVGMATVPKNLSDAELVMALQRATVKFGNTVSAAYHLFKHPTDPPETYIVRANGTLRSTDQHNVTLTHEGDARTVRFKCAGGSCVVLERDGRELFCTFAPK